MGYDTDFVVLLGFDIKDVEFDKWDDKYLPYIEGHEGTEFTIIESEMTNNYCFFGKVLAYHNERGSEIKKLPLRTSEDTQEKICKTANGLFDKAFHPIDIRLYSFTHKS